MIRILSIAIIVISLLVAGCGEEPAPPASPPAVSAPAPAATTAVAPPAETVEEVAEEPKFIYQAEGRRDPFLPLTVVRKPVGGQKDEPLTPLQKFELSQYRLMGIITGLEEPRALVSSPDGKSYILKKGMKIGKNEGKILRITDEVIEIEEKYYDFSGNVRTNIQEIRVPKREGV